MWMGCLYRKQALFHFEVDQLGASNFHRLTPDEFKTTRFEEWPGGNAGVGIDESEILHQRFMFDLIEQRVGHAHPPIPRVNEQHVDMSIAFEIAESRNFAIHDGDPRRPVEAASRPQIAVYLRPRIDLGCIVITRCKLADRTQEDVDHRVQVGRFIRPNDDRHVFQRENDTTVAMPKMVITTDAATWIAISPAAHP